jgi:hypothetical protein
LKILAVNPVLVTLIEDSDIKPRSVDVDVEANVRMTCGAERISRLNVTGMSK